MNSKAIKRQLLAAIAMVLVAAIALGSSTYAWFAAAGTVKAEGMSVQAQAESGLLIKELGASRDSFGTVAKISDDTKALFPASTADLTTWYHSLSTSASAAQGGENNTEGYEDASTLGSLDNYRYMKQFVIRSATEAAIPDAKLQISNVTVTNSTNSTVNLNTSIRVGVKVSKGNADDSAFYIYAPRSKDTNGTSYFTLVADYTGAGAANLKEYAEPQSDDYMTLAGNAIPADDTSLVVDIYIWYEGEDAECKTTNVTSNGTVLTPDALSVSVSFTKASV